MIDYVGTYQLDARPDRIDLRDRPYNPPLKSLEPEYPRVEYVELYFPYYEGLVLNQGQEGACTGFGLACTINYLLWRRLIVRIDRDTPPEEVALPSKVSPRMLYHLARIYDEWPGEDYEGSSCRGAVKAWHKHGVCAWDLWPYKKSFVKPKPRWEEDAATRPLGVYYRIDKNSVTDMQAAIQEVGAIYVSAKTHKGWNLGKSKARKITHDALPRITWSDGFAQGGGHALAFVGFNRYGFIVQNSWGSDWGLKGFATLAYDDWRSNGTDAWACVMGAPTEPRAKTYYVSSADREQSLADIDPVTFGLFKKNDQEHDYQDPAVKPWSEEQAYQHSVVLGNDGKVINRIVANNDAMDTLNDLVIVSPSAWLEQQGANGKHLMVYAHGGLNSEDDSIRRIRTLAPYFKTNGVYPLFFTWKTGLLESIIAIMNDSVGRLFPRSEGLEDLLREAKERASDALDRTLEVASENLGVKAIWSQMKQNASASAKKADNDRGAFLTVKALARLKRQHPTLKIHLVGHSAGSILLGHLLDDFPRNRLQAASCTLYAAACTVDFANKHFAKATDKKVIRKQDLHMHLLSDERERDDTVGPYRKSLLYLVSRALEDWHKTPLLGLVNVFDSNLDRNNRWSPYTRRHLEDWQRFWSNSTFNRLDDHEVVTAAQWKDGRIKRVIERIDTAHGSFDNDIEVIDQTIRRITGKSKLEHAVENLRY